MNDFTIFAAIKDSLISIYQLRMRPLLTWKLLIIVVIVVAVALLTGSMVSSHLDSNYQKREQGREAQRQTLQAEADQLRESARIATERAGTLESENKRLADEANQLRKSIEKIGHKREVVKQEYEQEKIRIEKSDDYLELRTLDCLKRKRLGYPCADQ